MERSNERKARFPIFRDRLNILLGDMSTTDFADKVDVSRQTMGFYLNGDRIPDSLTLARICKACGVSSDWLLGLTNDPKPRPCAADELGLTNKAIETVRNYSPDAKDGLSSLLENDSFRFVCDRISQYNKIPDSEKYETSQETVLSLADKYKSIERNLEERIVSSDNELAGKVKVLLGYNYSEFLRKEIVDGFEQVIFINQVFKSENSR